MAEKLFASRKDDGSAAKVAYEFGTGAGVYQPTPPRMIKPVLPQWRSVRPFVLTSAKQFPLAGPPAVDSAAYAKDFDEVKRLGSAKSTERTAQQTAIAIHWVGSEIATMNEVARAVSAEKKLGLVDNARLLALLNLSMADSLIAGYEAKYTYNSWRPITAVRNAATATNAAQSADPSWEPLIITPSHPEYPSAHALATGAGVAVLQAIYGSDTFSSSHAYPPALLRRWASFSEIARECEDARVWSGIHFRTSDEHGTRLGRQVAEFALKTALLPKGN